MHINTERQYTIYCEQIGCHNSDSVFSGDGSYRANDTPSRYFRAQGWRSDDAGRNMCPECAKKAKEREQNE